MSWSDCEVLKNVYPRARKVHVCDECGDSIRPGKIYNRQSVLFDGYVYTIKTCKCCNDWVLGLSEFVDLSEGWPLGEFQNAVGSEGYIGDTEDGQPVYQVSPVYDGCFGVVFGMFGKPIKVQVNV